MVQAVKDAIRILEQKPIQGEHGAFKKPFFTLYADEAEIILRALKGRERKEKAEVPNVGYR